MRVKEIVKILLWDIFNPFILRLKKNKKYPSPSNYAGINLGCGIENQPDWLGIDGGITHHLIHILPVFIIKPFYRSLNMSGSYTFDDYIRKIKSFKFIHHELLYGIPFPDNSVNNIYSSHFFEHLFREKTVFLVSESFRVLKYGGRIRICVPSLDEKVEHIKLAVSEFEKGNIHEIQKFVTSDITGFNSMYSNHRFMYTFNELSTILKEAGFIDIVQCEKGSGKIIGVEKLDTRGGLFVEAVKMLVI